MSDKKMPRIRLYGKQTLKWKYGKTPYLLHAWNDRESTPRELFSNVGIMACWHREYKLGDDIQDKSPENFWRRLVRENVPKGDIREAAKEGKLAGIRLVKCQSCGKNDFFDIFFGHECAPAYTGIYNATVADVLMDELDMEHCMTLMEPYAEWLPLWLYDHGGLAMSCGKRTGQFADCWDSMKVGWIVALKSKVMSDVLWVEPSEDSEITTEDFANGKPAKPLQPKPLTEEDWRTTAIQVMEQEVEVYNDYLTGNVFGYTVYEQIDDEWEETDANAGFFGDDIVTNGAMDMWAELGLKEAIQSGAYEWGTATLQTITTLVFD